MFGREEELSDEIKNLQERIEIIRSQISLPHDDECEKWFNENIDKDCSASSAVYKFRLWLKEREKLNNTK